MENSCKLISAETQGAGNKANVSTSRGFPWRDDVERKWRVWYKHIVSYRIAIIFCLRIAQALGDYGDTMKQIADFKDAMVGLLKRYVSMSLIFVKG